jgi:hypothetical protein
MAQQQTLEGHLSPEVLQRHGQPDLVLVLGSARVPVHKAVVSAGSKVLADLISSFDGRGELTLLGGGTSAGGEGHALPAAAKDQASFQLLLGQLYCKNCSLMKAEEALGAGRNGRLLALPGRAVCRRQLLGADTIGQRYGSLAQCLLHFRSL